jgi:uncharacterized protein (DUF1015 family)
MAVPLFRPFPGLRPRADLAQQVAAPPYDVLSSAEAARMAAGNPYSFLHISKPEIDLPPGTEIYSPAVYAKAAENLKALLDQGVLAQDPKASFYVYRLTMGDHVQTGFVGGASVAAYDANRVRKHEFTRPDKEDDRVRQIDACNAQTGPVLLAHRQTEALAQLIAQVTEGAPAFDIAAVDGNRHALWVVDEDGAIATIAAEFDAMKAVYIADGHHRSAAASRVAASRARPGAHESFLAVSFPITEMQILDYNRVVRDLNGLSPAEFLAAIAGEFDILDPDGMGRPPCPGCMGLYLDGRWHRLVVKNPPPADPVASLDVALLSDRLLAPVLGITDLRKDKRIDFVGGKRGLGELEMRVNSGEMAAAFAMFPPSMEQLVAVAEAGQVMPPKSTWFEPKLADGLVSYPL